ncbi:RidA family protein [Qipengyuania sp. 1NDW9]|uniref:RidA family protein n=1 Tax=Qipengyuania xiapuensis TaxID=2867236 RepID=A0ABX8ZVA5_9SPHN|nr:MULTISPECIES: RidA family protein [Qipengyuania]MBX7494166.1 RidA family protein [Qipengyuania xiapuensis]MBY6127161.1 RidA family protein [Qipengyuania aquimaris]QZD91754.1 RidA family protein [Qipengyuania xiapuensis]
MSVHERLREMGVELPDAAAPVASYQPVVVDGHTAYVSGQLPFVDGNLVTGKLGKDVSLERGQEAARACGLMILAQLEAAGLLERVSHMVKLGGFVASTPDFTDQPKVVNGASDLMFEVFGHPGKHARSAVGVPVLPLDAAVEVDAIVALKA